MVSDKIINRNRLICLRSATIPEQPTWLATVPCPDPRIRETMCFQQLSWASCEGLRPLYLVSANHSSKNRPETGHPDPSGASHFRAPLSAPLENRLLQTCSMILQINSRSRVGRIRRFRRGLPAKPERGTSLTRQRTQGWVISRDAGPIETPRGTAITVAVIAADRGR